MGILDFLKKGVEKKVEPLKQQTPPIQPKPGVSEPSATSSASSSQEYIIKPGDSLSKIAKRFYGDASKWSVIHMANKDIITDPNLIHPNQKIKIPTL